MTHPLMRHTFLKNWDDIPLNKPGPISVFKTILNTLKCQINSEWDVITGDDTFNFLKLTFTTWGHKVRTILKKYLVSKIKDRE